MSTFTHGCLGNFKQIMALLFLTLGASHAEAASSACRMLHPSDELIEWECFALKSTDSVEALFGEDWEALLRFNRIDRRHVVRKGTELKVPFDMATIRKLTVMPEFYEPAREEPKFILVNLAEQFLGAYEMGKLVFSFPATSGAPGHGTPKNSPKNEHFLITTAHMKHTSSKYNWGETERPAPMPYALLFYVTTEGAVWFHGRDMPGRPASHGCVGLYDESMQRQYYGYPKEPQLLDAPKLYAWALGPENADKRYLSLPPDQRIKVTIMGEPPKRLTDKPFKALLESLAKRYEDKLKAP